MSSVQRVVVTGVAGFVGSRLAARLLAEGVRVIGIDNLSQGLLDSVPDAVEFVEADVRDCALSRFGRIDAVAHLAAKNCLGDCEADPVATHEINVVGTQRIAHAAAEAGARRFLLASSSAVYENNAELPSRETTGLGADSAYGRSKIDAEAVVSRQAGLTVDILRYFNIYGPGQDYRRSQPPVLTSFVLAAMSGRAPVVFGTGSTRRDYVHVDDVNELHVLRLLGAMPSTTLNVGTGVTTTVAELLRIVQRTLGVDQEIRYQPATARDRVETWADVSSARALGWAPTRTLATGVAETVRFLEQERLAGRLVSTGT
jgi:UDP-glucose 4-epimerase